MRARDVDSASILYRSWVVPNMPDFQATLYTGPKSGGSPLADVTVAAKWKSGIPDNQIANFSLVDFLFTNSVPSNGSGNFTVGSKFTPIRSCKAIGVRFYWGAANKALKISIWDVGAASRMTFDGFVTGVAGVYRVPFTSIQTLTPFKSYAVTVYQTDGANYTNQTSVAAEPGSETTIASPLFFYTNFKSFIAGDGNPTSTAGSERYPVEPLLVGTG